jgi:ABC-type glutathione transport system ATPase component
MSQLVDIAGLNIRFTGGRTVYAVNDLSLSLGKSEVLGLLGESGSGKSVTLRALMRLLPKKRTEIAGSVRVFGRDILALALTDDELAAFRGQTVSMIFQEPALALDPVYTIGRQIAETVMRHEGKSYTQARARALEMLDIVRIPHRGHVCGPDRRAGHGARCRAHAGPSLCARAARRYHCWRQARRAAQDYPGHAALARPGATQLLFCAALQLCRSALQRGLAAQCPDRA